MIRRSAFRHVVVHLGLTVLLPLLASSVALAQAPLCPAVFESNEITYVELNQAFLSLANMKLTVDRTLSRGKLTTTEKQERYSFQKKLAALILQLEGRMSEAQVKNLLRDKVNELQGLKVVEEEARAKQNHEVRQEFDKLPVQQYIGRVDIPEGISGGKLNYIAANDTLIFMKNNRSLVQMDRAQQIETIEPSIRSYQVFGDEIVIIKGDGDLYRYDAKTNTKGPTILQGLQEYNRNSQKTYLIHSPRAEWVGTFDQNKITFYNTITGDRAPHGLDFSVPPRPSSILGSIKHFFTADNDPNQIKRASFIGENEVLIFTRDHHVYQLNILTGKRSARYAFQIEDAQITTSDTGLVFIWTEAEFAVFRAENFMDFESSTVFKRRQILGPPVFLPNDQILVYTVENMQFVQLVLNAKTLEPVDNLNTIPPPEAQLNSKIAPGVDSVGGRMFLAGDHLVQNPRYPQMDHIDIFRIRTQRNPEP